jgi:hypothetical protein
MLKINPQNQFNENDTMITIDWVALEHCPENQLKQGNDKGHETDAGVDIRLAENILVYPYKDMKYEWVDVGPIHNFMSHDVATALQLGDLKLNGDTLQRKKFKPTLARTGIKLVRTDPTYLSWVMIALRSNTIKMGVSMPHSFGVVDFKRN